MDYKVVAGFWLCASIAAWNAWRCVQLWWRLQRAQAWPSVPGTVTCSATWFTDTKLQRGLHFGVWYTFVRNGREVRGDTPRLSGDWFWNDATQKAFVARFVPGQAVRVFVDPAGSGRSCLDRTDRSGLAIHAIFFLAAVAGNAVLWMLVPDVLPSIA